MPENTEPPRRFLVEVRGVLSIDAYDSDTAYRIAEEWTLTIGKNADENAERENGILQVRWLRTEPESNEFPGWQKPRR